MDIPLHFARIEGAVDVEYMQRCTVAIVGVGAVGSRVAEELARSGVGTLVLVDGKRLEPEHLARHVLGADSLGRNKAIETAEHLMRRVPDLTAIGVDGSIHGMPNVALGALLSGADLVIAATDDRRAQRRVNRRALGMDIPAIFPGVDAQTESGEVFVSFGRGLVPCFGCWDRFRDENSSLRAVTGLAVDLLPTVHVTVRLALGVLDPNSSYAQLMAPDDTDPRLRTLFFVGNAGTREDLFAGGRTFRRAVAPFRNRCRDCGRIQRAVHWIQSFQQAQNRTWTTG